MGWLLAFWPYLLSALAVVLWLAVMRKRLHRRLEFIIVGWVACTLANMAVEFGAAYLVPLDIAGTAPPDPRNAHLRFLVTAAIQVPVSFVLSYYIAARTRFDRWQEP
jgi:hypothetical protein